MGFDCSVRTTYRVSPGSCNAQYKPFVLGGIFQVYIELWLLCFNCRSLSASVPLALHKGLVWQQNRRFITMRSTGHKQAGHSVHSLTLIVAQSVPPVCARYLWRYIARWVCWHFLTLSLRRIEDDRCGIGVSGLEWCCEFAIAIQSQASRIARIRFEKFGYCGALIR